ncbi:MAG: prepilin-type N-terminal cleavage/methylation domain-containing protein [Candidatus Eremiobacterota bacterium]
MRGRGLTLPELLVGMALLGLLLTILMQLLTPSLHIWDVNRARSDADQAALVLLPRLTRELCATSRQSVTTARGTVSFLSTGSLEPGYDPRTGKPIWRLFVIYYLDEPGRELYRREWPLAAPTSRPVRLTPGELAGLASDGRRASRGVSGFQMTDAAGEPLRLQVEFVRSSRSGLERTLRTVDLWPRYP